MQAAWRQCLSPGYAGQLALGLRASLLLDAQLSAVLLSLANKPRTPEEPRFAPPVTTLFVRTAYGIWPGGCPAVLASMILFTHSFPHTLQVKVLRITMDVSFDPCSDSMLPSERTLRRCFSGAAEEVPAYCMGADSKEREFFCD